MHWKVLPKCQRNVHRFIDDVKIKLAKSMFGVSASRMRPMLMQQIVTPVEQIAKMSDNNDFNHSTDSFKIRLLKHGNSTQSIPEMPGIAQMIVSVGTSQSSSGGTEDRMYERRNPYSSELMNQSYISFTNNSKPA